MKRILLLFFLSTQAMVLFSQGFLEQLFYTLPMEYWHDWDLEKKKMMVEEMKDNVKNGDLSLSILDEKNGYLRYISYQCISELCYWNIPFKDAGEEKTFQIIAIVTGCNNKPQFLMYKDRIFYAYTVNVIEIFSALYFFKDNTKLGDIKPYLECFNFQLPQKGTDIIVNYKCMDWEQPQKQLLKGDKIKFIWDNGEFKMGDPYF